MKRQARSLEEAIAVVQSGSMSLREAARKFHVPRTTLQRRVQLRASAALRPAGSERVTAAPIAIGTDAENDSTGDNTLAIPRTIRRDVPVVGQKRPANDTEMHNQGPRKVINCKIRMLCTAAGSALDELSNDMIKKGKCIYKLGLGQSPFPIPQCIVDELRANSHQRDYLPVAGLPELCDDIAAWGADRLHVQYSRDDVLVGPGTKELLFVLQTVYYGDLLLPNPSCTSYAPQAAIAGRNMMWLPTHAEDHFVLRPEVLDAHCAKDPGMYAPRILILNSPSNPTGCAYQANELEALAKVARKYRILVVSDEIYSELHHSGTHLSLSKYYREGTIVSGGLSKWCGAGGWRMGFWLFPPSMDWLRSSMLVMASETYTSVASPIQHAARRAFVLDCVELASYKRKCQKTLQLIGRWFAYQLQKMDIEVQVPEAGFYLFPCFRRHCKALAKRGIVTDEQLCAQLLQDTGVAILPGSAFGRAPEELFARLAFVDFKGDLALYLIESMQDEPSLDAIDGFVQSVCPNLDIAMHKLAAWIALARPSAVRASTRVSGATS
uniref:HTH psq-type domain-containing protein n=1 Tax=Peronospora matthiolae TaxID=2874970 RepID=A0AAV1V1A4_9STRA